MYIPSDNVFRNFQSNYTKSTLNNAPSKAVKPKNENLKRAVVLTAAAGGMLMGLLLVGKQQGRNTFTKEGYKAIEHSFKAMSTLAGFSLLGGVSAGIALDRKNTKNKLREGFQQFVGNIIFPLFAVTQGDKIFSKYCKNSGLARSLSRAGLLAVGLFAGNKIANGFNNFIFDDKQDRKLRISDLSGHLDDVCFATTLAAEGTKLGAIASVLIAPALVVPGYVAGTATHNSKH